jgi:hypothetical protein
LDGKMAVGHSGEQDEAERFYLLTDRGRIGQRFRVASEYAIDTLADELLQHEESHRFQPHCYEVIDRVDTRIGVLVRVRYVREEIPG